MSDEPESGPAERRLDEHLELLRATPPQSGTALVPAVIRKARWQSHLRAPLRVVGMIAYAFAHGLGALFGASKRTDSR